MDESPPTVGSATLVLSVVVVGLVSVGFVLPRLQGHTGHGPAKASSDIAQLRNGLNRFRIDCNRFPTTGEGLGALISGGNIQGWHGPYVERLPQDPWGRDYRYWNLGWNEVKVASLGEDGKLGGEAGTTNEDVGT
jgi:general secretion pathway protein G